MQPQSSEVKAKTYLDTKSRIRVSDFRIAKEQKQKWAMLTSYDFVSASIFDKAGIPCILIGDSASQVVFGKNSTISITVDEMILLSRIVSSACKRAFVVADLPFGSYRESPKQALRTATRFLKEANVHGVKVEGGIEIIPHVELLTQSGIPVMGHIGLQPQSENTIGGFKIQGRTSEAIDELIYQGSALAKAGAFACVVELVPSEAGKLLTETLDIPVIGIGAGPDCDAQVLVWADMAGYKPPDDKSGYLNDKSEFITPKMPKFVKQYTNLGENLHKAAISFAEEVSSGTFPAIENCYK